MTEPESIALTRLRERVERALASGSLDTAYLDIQQALDDARRDHAIERGARHSQHLASGPRVPSDLGAATQRLRATLDATHDRARAERDAQDEGLAKERAQLVPIRDKAQAAVRALEGLQAEHGALVQELVATDWAKLRSHLPPTGERLLNRIASVVKEAHQALFSDATALRKIPTKLDALTPDQLRTTAEIPTPVERMSADVNSLASAPGRVEEHLRELTRLLDELDAQRLPSPFPYRTIERSRPVRESYPQAVTDYDVLTGAPNGTRR